MFLTGRNSFNRENIFIEHLSEPTTAQKIYQWAEADCEERGLLGK